MDVTMPKWQAAWESAKRTFVQTALPAFIAAVSLSRPDGVALQDFVVAAAVSAAAAGLAAALRSFVPLKTDAVGVGVEGVSATDHG